MKKLLILLLCITSLSVASNSQILKKLGNKIKDKTNQRVDQKTDQTIDKGLDKTEDATKKNGNNSVTDTNSNTNNGNNNNTTEAAPASIKTYQNYDFVPGDKVLFEDHFTDDQDGEFPSHWELTAGQATQNKVKTGEEAFFLTEGNYVRVNPRMKTETYLTDPFTIEYDTYFAPGTYGPIVMLGFKDKDGGNNRESGVHISRDEASFDGNEVKFSKSYPEDLKGDNFDNKWHHVAIAYKNKQLKIYVDQYRILVVPDTKETYDKMSFAGIGSDESPIIVKNLRIAAGGQMNMIGKKFTESKIVTHGINFDIDKAIIKPESMGTLNMIVQVMKDNPDIKFEVDGHTDNTGTAPHNLTLSQQRADAVKDQLIKMGIDASRLTSKGFGDTKPIGDNNTLEGKANNRRVEFVKM
ncbi:MAG: OmpA family protein [Chitinophagales bacterium]